MAACNADNYRPTSYTAVNVPQIILPAYRVLSVVRCCRRAVSRVVGTELHASGQPIGISGGLEELADA